MTDDKPVRAVVWAAVSTRSQANEDKASLPDQEQQGRALAAREGWHLVDTLSVPGHSRRYLDFHELARDARNENITAFDDLLRLIDQHAFDVLIVRDGDRFARTQALHAFITESIIDAGARIYSLADGWIDRTNYRMWIALSGYRAAGEIDQLVAKSRTGKIKRMQKGLPNKAPSVSHICIRDSFGKALHMELRPGMERFWADLADLVIQGKTWLSIGDQMYAMGYRHPDTGGRYDRSFLRRLMYHPNTWGVAAMNWRHHIGLWVFGDEPVPEGVIAEFNAMPPIYTGVLADKLKAELRRRVELIRGSAKPDTTYMFRGIIRCAHCDYVMGRKMKTPRLDGTRSVIWCCQNRFADHPLEFIHQEIAIAQINDFLVRWLALAQPQLPLDEGAAQQAQRLQTLQTDITSLTRQIEVMIRQEAQAAENVRALYTQQIAEAATRLEALKKQAIALNKRAETPQAPMARELAYDTLLTLGVLRFWQQEERLINQTLHALLGKAKFIVQGNEIVGLK